MKVLKGTMLLAGLSAALWGAPASAHECKIGGQECTHWTDSSGKFIQDGNGECVQAAYWRADARVVGCNAEAEAPKPMPPVAMVVADTDGDGVKDDKDRCPGTPSGAMVDVRGCALDSDADGVADYNDRCPSTPMGATVDGTGCALDSDADGIADYKDRCPATPAGATVDSLGCVLDTDADGIADYRDKCPNSVAGARVNANGCEIKITTVLEQNLSVQFTTNSADIRSGYEQQFEKVASFMKEHPQTRLIIEGHTDSIGAAEYNAQLSQQRAASVADHIAERYGVERTRIQAQGLGESQPVADNTTAAGRAQNRRVVAVVKAVVER